MCRQPTDADRSDALIEVNKQKNRYPDRVPCELHTCHTYICDMHVHVISLLPIHVHVHVFPYIDNVNRARLRPTGAPGADYINASFVDVSPYHCS